MADPMGLAAGYGAGTVSGSLDELLRRRLLEQEQARLERAQQAQEAQFAASLAEQQAGRAQRGDQFAATHGLARKRFGRVELPESQAGLDLTRARTTGEGLENEGRRLIHDVRQRGTTDWGALTPGERVLGFGVGEETPGAVREADEAADLRRISAQGAEARRTTSHRFALEQAAAEAAAEAGPQPGAGGKGGLRELTPSMRAGVTRLLTNLNQLVALDRSMTQREGLAGVAEGMFNQAAGKLKLNNEAAVYEAIGDAMLPGLARSSGEVGNLAEREQTRFAKLVPRVTDPVSLRAAKIEAISQLIRFAIEGKSADEMVGILDDLDDVMFNQTGIERPTSSGDINRDDALSRLDDIDAQRRTGREMPRIGAPREGPAVGTQRTINGTLAEWDGQGWVAVRK